MNSIEDFFQEASTKDRLRAACYEYWDKLLHVVATLEEDNLENISKPFLIEDLPAYRKANRKVLFVGQETN